jgi:molybdate transport system ATP-binding protein
MADEPLVVFQQAAVSRQGNDPLLRELTWTIREGETWAVVGSIASGKTTLLEAILGKHRISEGELAWPFVETLKKQGRAVEWPSDAMRMVAFKENSRVFSYANRYYQQRFDFADAEEPLSLDEFLRAGSEATEAELNAVTERLGIAKLRSLSFMKLSNGQTRRARIARALLGHPQILLLDDPFVGLDAGGRAEIERFLGELIQQGQRLVIAVTEDAIPSWVTGVVKLEAGNAKILTHREWEARKAAQQRKAVQRTLNPSGEPIVEFHRVTVKYGEKIVLNAVDWILRAGERWALVGPNGSGKSTLLSLICGDHPQAYSNDIRLFGVRRGSGESIWDVKRPIGLVSPEFHLYFHGSLKAFDVAATGVYDVITYRKATPEQANTVRELFASFDLLPLIDRRFAQLSSGEQRLVLLVRALVKRPNLLVLDEPFQGLDSETIERIRNWLDTELRSDQAMIFVSHRPEEIPATVDHWLELRDGRIVLNNHG